METSTTAQAENSESLRIRFIGESLSYNDQSEARLLVLLRQAEDRSTGSDELARQITDWPTQYHLSRLRSHLLRPFRFGPGLRVLEIGAGTGALSRYLGEQGVEVTALEGNLQRAQATALRCLDLPQVAVVCGPVAAFRDDLGFDAVLLVGVLEYAATAASGANQPQTLLAQARALLKSDGVLILAIENQIGLKYLLGHEEDHLQRPWVGLEGYQGEQIRTFSRRALTEMLHAAGFPAQRWLFPFPDYKLPRSILSERLLTEPQLRDVVDQLVRFPNRIGSAALSVAERACHRTLLAGGLGTELANSFLIAAAATDAGRFLPADILAWCFSDERRRHYQRMKTVRSRQGSELQVEATLLDSRGTSPAAAEDEDARASSAPGWLQHHPREESRFVVGETLEQLLLAACAHHDPAAVQHWLLQWTRFLDAQPQPVPPDSPHPFCSAQAQVLLAPHCVDVDFANFVVTPAGEIHYIDDEWQARQAVDGVLVRRRALWHLARDLVIYNCPHPWPATLSVDELTAVLARLIGISATRAELAVFFAAEAELQHAISERDPGEFARHLADLGRKSQLSWNSPGPTENPAATSDVGMREHLRQLHRAALTAQKDYTETIGQLRAALETQLAQIAGLNQVIAEKDQILLELVARHQEAQSAYETEIHRLVSSPGGALGQHKAVIHHLQLDLAATQKRSTQLRQELDRIYGSPAGRVKLALAALWNRWHRAFVRWRAG